MLPAATSCISTRDRRRPPMPPGRFRCTTRKASMYRTLSIVTTWPRGCRSSTTLTDHSTYTSRRVRRALIRKPTGCPRPPAGRSISRCEIIGRRKQCSTVPINFRRLRRCNEVPATGAEGILVTEGGRFGGYGLYLLKGKPVFTYNLLDLARIRWEGAAPLTHGRH